MPPPHIVLHFGNRCSAGFFADQRRILTGMARDHSGFSSKQPGGAVLAVGAVLTELMALLVERDVITTADAHLLLSRALDGLGKSRSSVSHTDATALIKKLMESFDKSSA